MMCFGLKDRKRLKTNHCVIVLLDDTQLVHELHVSKPNFLPFCFSLRPKVIDSLANHWTRQPEAKSKTNNEHWITAPGPRICAVFLHSTALRIAKLVALASFCFISVVRLILSEIQFPYICVFGTDNLRDASFHFPPRVRPDSREQQVASAAWTRASCKSPLQGGTLQEISMIAFFALLCKRVLGSARYFAIDIYDAIQSVKVSRFLKWAGIFDEGVKQVMLPLHLSFEEREREEKETSVQTSVTSDAVVGWKNVSVTIAISWCAIISTTTTVSISMVIAGDYWHGQSPSLK